jgi:glyoxylase-like metal-dependent hydrolase (beta-lactamase superfamily II)
MKLALMNSMMLLAVLCQVSAAAEQSGLQKISNHVYAYVNCTNPSPSANSFGANVGVIIGKDGVLVVDTLVSAKEGRRLLADIRKITDKPIKFVVNTHYHLDHAWGNCAFVETGAVIISQDNSREALRRESAYGLAHYEQFDLTAKDIEGTTLVEPAVTFSDRMTVSLGDVTAELVYRGPTHTKDSITVYVPEDKVLFTGDILFTRYHPYLGEGDFQNWPRVLDELAKVDAVAIIPGHGPVSTKNDLKDMKEYIRVFDTQAKLLSKGKSASDAPAIAKELIKRLPDQKRTVLEIMIQSNLSVRYLPKPEAK